MEAVALEGEPGLVMRTYNPEYKYTFKWTFDNFSEIPIGTHEKSSEFIVDSQSNWHVEFKKTESEYILHIFRNAEANAVLHYNISILDCNNEVLYNAKRRNSISMKEFKSNILPLKSCLGKLESVPNDRVLFAVFIKILLLPLKTVDKSNISLSSDLQQKQLEKLSRDFKNMLDNKTAADFTLRVQGENIAVHKNILFARSSVFACMFQQGMAENEDNVVRIEDISMDTMKALVSFMYSGVLVDYDFDTAMNVYYAADKYSVMDLRDICGLNLVSKLTLDNAHKVLYLANLHEDLALRDRVMQYIACHRKTSGSHQMFSFDNNNTAFAPSVKKIMLISLRIGFNVIFAKNGWMKTAQHIKEKICVTLVNSAQLCFCS